MTITKLAISLTIIFIITIGVLILFLLRHRHRLLYYFCLKSRTRVKPSGASTEAPDGPNRHGSSQEDPVIDVFKLLEANGPSRFLCTIKEEESEYVIESGSIIGVPDKEKVSLQACLEAEAAAERTVRVELETVASSPCDSPMFFTPVGSPSRMGIYS